MVPPNSDSASGRSRTRTAIVASMLFLAVGCGAKKPTVTSERTRPTGLSADEIAAVVLLEYDNCYVGKEGKESCDDPRGPTTEESKFLKCLSRGERRVHLASSKEVRETISVSSKAKILEALNDDSLRNRLLESNYRYLVLLDVSTRTSHNATSFDGAYVVWMIGSEKSKTSTLNAVVWDLEENQEAGTLRSVSSGSKGFVLPVVLIIPLPPVAWSSFTEKKACRGLGESLGQFLRMEDGP